MKIIFGGAFNPIHNEHINMIKYLLKMEDVDRVVLVPSANPPHKQCDTSFAQRVEMIKLAIQDIDNSDRIEICDIESKDDCKHYTCEVLPKLKRIYNDIAFVIGGDSLEDFSTWKNPQDIIKICPLYVFTRGKSEKFDKALEHWRSVGAEIIVCDYCPKDISSTLVRYNAILGEYDNISPKVAQYIRQSGLYLKYTEQISKLKNNIPAHTFEHCSRTAKYALWLNYSLDLGLDYDKVLLAGLFHDCAKALCHLPHSLDNLPSDCIGTPVEHQFLGAIVAKNDYNICDVDVLEAIKYHTTGKKSMNKLQKLIFCADMLELGRSYPEVEYLRDCISKTLDFGYRECALAQYKFLQEKGGDIYPLTIEAIEEFKN